MEPTEHQERMFRYVSENQWFTNDNLAEAAKVALGTAQRYTRFLERLRIVDRVDRHPAPLFKRSQAKPTADGAEYLEKIQALSEASNP